MQTTVKLRSSAFHTYIDCFGSVGDDGELWVIGYTISETVDTIPSEVWISYTVDNDETDNKETD